MGRDCVIYVTFEKQACKCDLGHFSELYKRLKVSLETPR